MATADTFTSQSANPSNAPAGSAPATTAYGSLLVSLSPLDHDGLRATLANLSAAFSDETLLVATPDASPNDNQAEKPAAESYGATESTRENIRIILYTATVNSPSSWVLTAPDYFNAYKIAKDHGATSVLMLGADSGKITPETLRAMIDVVDNGADLASPGYVVGPRDALVNAAILYPVTRALFGTKPRFPLAIDLGLSLRMAERLATAAQRFTAINQTDALIWPLAEAAAAGFTIGEVPGVVRTLPQPGGTDLNTVLARVAGSLFADVDAKAALWQRVRMTQARATLPQAEERPAEQPTDVTPMLESFRIGYSNLMEIWSLVLPPNSLLGLKRLSVTPAATFRMPDALWARIIFDFILAYRLRTLNRGHLLGALTPLYLAWVASHVQQATNAAAAERHIESVAAAFEADKPYLVSRWRWPDRFNP